MEDSFKMGEMSSDADDSNEDNVLSSDEIMSLFFQVTLYLHHDDCIPAVNLFA